MSTRKIAILLGGVEISGGINVIFQHAIQLAAKNYEISFITRKRVSASQIEWHPIHEFIRNQKNSNISWYTFNELENLRFDVAMATWWRSFFDLWKVNADSYLYFVQSIESRFYSPNEISLRSVVESTYELDLGFITECNWISSYLSDIYRHDVPVALNGIDKAVFREDGARKAARTDDSLRVLVEGPVNVPFKNVPGTINMVRRSAADEAWLLTSSAVETVEGIDQVFSQIPMQQTPEVYRSCDLIIKLSYVEGMFGPPLEMFHCGGTCIVYDVTGHDEYLLHKQNGIVVKTDSENEVVAYINELKENKNLLQRLKTGARETASAWPDWKQSNDMFEKAIEKGRGNSRVSNELLKRYSKRIWHIYEYKNY